MVFQDVYTELLIWPQCFIVTKKGHLAVYY